VGWVVQSDFGSGAVIPLFTGGGGGMKRESGEIYKSKGEDKSLLKKNDQETEHENPLSGGGKLMPGPKGGGVREALRRKPLGGGPAWP